MFGKCVIVTRLMPYPESTGGLQYSAQIIRIVASIFTVVEVVCQRYVTPFTKGVHPNFPPNVYFNCYEPTAVGLVAKITSLQPNATVTIGGEKAQHCLRDQLDKVQPELIVIDHIGSSWAATMVDGWRKNQADLAVIYCTHNEEYTTRWSIAKAEWRRPLYSVAHIYDAMCARYTDLKMIRVSDFVTCISGVDVELYRKLHSPKKIDVFPALYNGAIAPERVFGIGGVRKVCIIGSFLWSAKKNNLNHFLRLCSEPLLNQGIELSVIGNMEPQYLATMREAWPNVFFSGYVEDINSFLVGMDAGIVAEDIGGGFKLKLLDYVFQRLPIFALKHAVTETTLVDGESIMLYPTMTALCQGVIMEIDNSAKLSSLAEKAFSECKSFIDKQSVEHIFQDIVVAAFKK